MKKREQIKNRGKQGFAFDKGAYMNAAGARKYRRHWLGQDRHHAETVAKFIAAEWGVIKANGGDTWDAGALERIETAKRGMRNLRQSDVQTVVSGDGKATGSGMLYDAIKQYVDSVADDAKIGQVSGNHAINAEYGMTALKSVLGDTPLSSLGYDELRKVVNHFVSRPISPQTGKKLAAKTVVSYLAEIRSFFAYAAKRKLWACSTPLNECFAYKRDKLVTTKERVEASRIKTFTLDELKTLWTWASERQRLYLLLCLNCGFTQIDVATLLPEHCHLDAVSKLGKPIPFIRRHRNKTLVESKWRLWPETAFLLRKFAAKKSDSPMLLNEDGKPLVYYVGTNRCDSIRLHWQRLLKLCNSLLDTTVKIRVRPLGLKYLRKTGSDIVRKLGGKDMSETYLAHADNTMGKVYNNADFKRLGKTLRRVRKFLEPMFAADKMNMA